MSNKMTEDEIYKEAEKRVKAKRELYVHIGVYVCVNTFLIIIWAVNGGGSPWFIWPLAGWGIGLVFHILDVLVWQRKSDRTAIEKEANKIRKEQQ